jgi:hypothetical protein
VEGQKVAVLCGGTKSGFIRVPKSNAVVMMFIQLGQEMNNWGLE